MNDRSPEHEAMLTSALSLAISVDVADRIANDPYFPANRNATADAARAVMLAADLEKYRDARSTFEASL